MPTKRKSVTHRTIAHAAAVKAKEDGLRRIVDRNRRRVRAVQESQLVGGVVTLALIVAAIMTGAVTAFVGAFALALFSAKCSRDGRKLEDAALDALAELTLVKQGKQS